MRESHVRYRDFNAPVYGVKTMRRCVILYSRHAWLTFAGEFGALSKIIYGCKHINLCLTLFKILVMKV